MLENQLEQYFGFTSFQKGQKEVVTNLLEGKSAAAIFPTGAGKSLCYQFPALLLPGLTLVVSPLLSLMKDQLDFLLKHNIPAARLDSTLGREAYTETIENAVSGNLKILMISVERFKNERFRYHLAKMKISLLVVDEAHCISEWGHNFRPEYLMLPHYRSEFNIPQVLLLTATATREVAEDMCRKLQVPRECVTITGFYRNNLFLQVTPAEASRKKQLLLQRLGTNPNQPTIVYVTLQKTAEEVANFLCENSIIARAYHAGMKSELREDIQGRFIRGEVPCIVATIAFGMGIDKSDIRRVVHYDLPKTLENFSQEIGRSGRDGNPAFCEVLGDRSGLCTLENFIYGDTPEKDSIGQLLQNIKENQDRYLELSIYNLSKALNIRDLPLKTLLVYLQMEGILKPSHSYFQEYSFKYIRKETEIIQAFTGERREFVTALLAGCVKKRVWTQVDMDRILTTCPDRKRVITALEYFHEKNWIELAAKQMTEVYVILNRDFDTREVTNRVFGMFSQKEVQEIERIRTMVSFLESDKCLSKTLSSYFGDQGPAGPCGHCSVCMEGRATLPEAGPAKPLSEYSWDTVTAGLRKLLGENITAGAATRFLCGISIPLFSRRGVKKLPEFGKFERHPFSHVRAWAENQVRDNGYQEHP